MDRTRCAAWRSHFLPPDGEEWRTGMNDIPVFPREGRRRPSSTSSWRRAPDPKTGKPDPAALQAFLAAHPETVRALGLIKAAALLLRLRQRDLQCAQRLPASSTRRARSAGALVDGARSMPSRREPAETPADKNYLFDALAERLKQPAQWRLVLTLRPARRSRPATRRSPGRPTARQVDAGTLTLTQIEGEDHGACRDVNYDPLVLPAGIEASDDPLLSARSAAYSRSFTRRVGETKPPSAVQPGEGELTMSPAVPAPVAPAALADGRMILTMLFIGVAMVASLADYHRLVAIHRPLGILLLVLVAIRLINRLLAPPPPLPATCRAAQARGARFALAALWPDVRAAAGRLGHAVGRAAIRSSRGGFHLPPILPHDGALRRPAPGAHGPGLPAVPDLPRPSRRGADARPGIQGRRLPQHGEVTAVENGGNPGCDYRLNISHIRAYTGTIRGEVA